MGTHQEQENNLSPKEKLLKDYLKHGDDFMKIEIYRNARKWYQKAVELDPENEEAKSKLQDCNEKLKKETQTILYIAVVAAIIVLGIIIF